jgi:hypothetical protein
VVIGDLSLFDGRGQGQQVGSAFLFYVGCARAPAAHATAAFHRLEPRSVFSFQPSAFGVFDFVFVARKRPPLMPRLRFSFS